MTRPPLPVHGRFIKRLTRRLAFLESKPGPQYAIDEAAALRAVLTHLERCPCSRHRWPKEALCR